MPTMNRPLESPEDFLTASLDPRALRKRFGLPHPLSKFAANGEVKDNAYADAILRFLNDSTWAEPGSVRHRGAHWFLFESEKAFFVACLEAGVDAEKLRNQLLECESSGICDEELEAGI